MYLPHFASTTLGFRTLQSVHNMGEAIVGKKSGILDPSRFWGQIRKVEARLGKLANIRKIETD